MTLICNLIGFQGFVFNFACSFVHTYSKFCIRLKPSAKSDRDTLVKVQAVDILLYFVYFVLISLFSIRNATLKEIHPFYFILAIISFQ